MIPVVYYRHHPRYLLGPLGCFEIGDTLALDDGREVRVCSLDADGMAIAWDTTYLEERAAPGQTIDDVAATFARVRTTHGDDWLTDSQRRGIARTIAGNRARALTAELLPAIPYDRSEDPF